jgi:tripartite ATP-independent transporter DctM subunit
MFAVLFALVFLGIPISFALFATAALFGLSIFGPNIIGIQLFGMLQQTASTQILSAIPPFVLMGCVLERSGIAERLFQVLQLWLGRMPGGLALTTISMGAIFAAATGIVGAVEIVIGVMAIPVMMRYGYNKGLIAGTICAGGSLGTMIPPSLVAVIYASIANMSVGKLYAAMLLPGSLMVGLFLLYILIRSVLRPQDSPPVPRELTAVPVATKLWLTLTGFVPAVFLIAAVLGTTMLGIASPTEAASVGAAAAVVLTALYGRLTSAVVKDALIRTLLITSMIMLIVAGGTTFASVFRLQGGERLVSDLVTHFDLTAGTAILLCMLIVFVAGIVLDWVSIVLITLPIFLPIIKTLQIDPIWFATMMIVVIQTSYLTPPMAPSIFYLKAIAPPEMTYRDMCFGVLPYVLMQLATLFLVAVFPWLATYLPDKIVGF